MYGYDEAIARFVADVRQLGCIDPGMPAATILVREANGRMSLHSVDLDCTLGQHAPTGAFRRGDPIIDPVSRRIIGYEMEPADQVMGLRTG